MKKYSISPWNESVTEDEGANDIEIFDVCFKTVPTSENVGESEEIGETEDTDIVGDTDNVGDTEILNMAVCCSGDDPALKSANTADTDIDISD